MPAGSGVTIALPSVASTLATLGVNLFTGNQSVTGVVNSSSGYQLGGLNVITFSSILQFGSGSTSGIGIPVPIFIGPSAYSFGGTNTFLCGSGVATTGVTTCVFQDGAGQGTTAALQILNNTGRSSLQLFGSGGFLSQSAGSYTGTIPGAGQIFLTDGSSTVKLEMIMNGGGQGIVSSTGIYAWVSSSDTSTGTKDTNLSRDSAGVIDFGTGAQGSKAGSWQATNGTLSGALTYTGPSYTVGDVVCYKTGGVLGHAAVTGGTAGTCN
jgi:hypothetical protein